MQFENSFSVDAPLEHVWTYLLDVRAVAPCLPGAEITETVSETEYKGSVKVKLGAMQMNYKGTLVLKEVDHEAHSVVLTATGSDARGTGGASGTVTSTLTAEAPARTTVHIVSDVNITGRVAQFGRNIIQDVSNKLTREFAQCLEAHLVANPAADGEASGNSSEPAAVETATEPLAEAGTAASAGPPGQITGPNTTPPSPSVPRPAEPATTPGAYPPAGAAEIKLMPLLVDITKSRVARGLRSIAGLLDPDK